MLTRIARTTLTIACVACIFSAVGCSAQNASVATTAHNNSNACANHLDQLIAKLDRPKPYPHRKPVRDNRARILRQISQEAEHLLAEPSAEAMTGDAGIEATPAGRQAIENLRDAAQRGDATGVRIAYHQYKNAE